MLRTDDGIVFQAFKPQDVLGKTIICECGEPHLVEQISYSHKYADMMLLNEHDESMPSKHYWVHILSLCRQMHGEPLPNPEEKAAASRFFNCLRWEPTDRPSKGGSGLILPNGTVLNRK